MEARHEFSNDKEYKKYLRTYFAGLAMQGFCSNKSILMPNNKIEPEELLASMSITIADELLKQLEEK